MTSMNLLGFVKILPLSLTAPPLATRPPRRKGGTPLSITRFVEILESRPKSGFGKRNITECHRGSTEGTENKSFLPLIIIKKG